MSGPHGRFVWYELLTPDPDAAEAYYTSVVGWGTLPTPGRNGPYTLFTVGETPVCGVMKQPEGARKIGAPPTWLGYVLVDDVDATTSAARRRGATVYVEPRDIPEVCRFSVFTDPQNALMGTMSWSLPPGKEASGVAATPGRVGWHELHAADFEEGYDFYNTLFGWEKSETFEVGEIGIYQVFAAGGQPVGGMFSNPPAAPATLWLYYFNVADFDAAVERITAFGGEIANGPMEVPGGSWIIQAKDPQGALFALVGRRG